MRAYCRPVDADEQRQPNLPLRVAAALYGVGMLILLSPVISDVPFDGQFSRSGDFSSICGLTLTSAFVTPAEDDEERERKLDCAAKASDRVGYGLLALALAAPWSAAALAKRQPTR